MSPGPQAVIQPILFLNTLPISIQAPASLAVLWHNTVTIRLQWAGAQGRLLSVTGQMCGGAAMMFSFGTGPESLATARSLKL